jgi:hypothetical protein
MQRPRFGGGPLGISQLVWVAGCGCTGAERRQHFVARGGSIRLPPTLATYAVKEAAETHRQSLKNPPKSIKEFLASPEAQGLPQSVAALRILFQGLAMNLAAAVRHVVPLPVS